MESALTTDGSASVALLPTTEACDVAEKGGNVGSVDGNGNNQTDASKIITPMQETFCLGIVGGLTQCESYRRAFNVGDKTKRVTVDGNASVLARKPHIVARIATLRQPGEKIVKRSYERWIQQLERFAFTDLKQVKITAADVLKAHELYGKATGLYVEKAPVQSPLESAATETLVEMLKEVRERRQARRNAELPIEVNPQDAPMSSAPA